MNCQECIELLVPRLEGLLDESVAAAVTTHLRGCDECRREADQFALLHARLATSGSALAKSALAQPVMDRILRTTTHQLRRKVMFQRAIRIGAGLSVAAAIAVVAILLFAPPAGTPTANAAEMFANGAKAAANLKTVHFVGRIRSLPREDIEFIGLDLDFVSLEMWKQYEPTEKWRIEKTGRVIVMDGQQLVTLVKPDIAFKRAALSNANAFWLAQLLDVDRILEIERDNAARDGTAVKSVREGNELVVTVQAKARGNFTSSDWMKNRSLSQSDNRRVFRFDPQTNRLKSLDVFVQAGGKETLVFQITQIEYNPQLDEKLFEVDLPANVRWVGEIKPTTRDAKYVNMTPKEFATAFFDALARSDWNEVDYMRGMKISDRISVFGGLKVIKVGEPFQSGLFQGWFVPYEVNLSNGEVHKFNLAVRNDTPTKRWLVDGGL